MSLSDQFTQVLLGDFANNLIDISNYLESFNTPIEASGTDLTSFQPGGAPTVDYFVRGAAIRDVTLSGFHDPFLLNLAMQLWGLRTGSTLQIKQGKNAMPTFGDALYQGTFTLFDITPDLTSGNTGKVQLHFLPTDGGLIVPAWSTI